MSCCDHDCQPAETGGRYRRILWVALGLNAAMFLIEIVASVIAGSVSLRPTRSISWAMRPTTPSRSPSSVSRCTGVPVPRCSRAA